MTDSPIKTVEADLNNLSVKDIKETAGATDASAAVSASRAEGAPAASTEDSAESAFTATPAVNSLGSLYVGELALSVTEAVLFDLFSTIGAVASIRVCRDAVTRESLGYAYVNYHKHEDAQKALQELNHAVIDNRAIRIMWSQRDPSVRKTGKGNVFIKNLDPSIDNRALHDTFAAFGEILSAKVVTDSEGRSQGFGFIHFAEPESAATAIRLVNGMNLNNREVFVGPHLTRGERDAKVGALNANFTNVYVKNLPADIDEDGLKEMFGKFGDITSSALAKDANGKSKGFAFVNFAKHEDAAKAVEDLNDSETSDGRKLYVSRAQNKFERQTELKKRFEAQRQEMITKYQNTNLYIKNLDESVTDDMLREAFSPFGTITSAKVMLNERNKSRGFGFVCYSNAEEAARAISEMQQHVLVSKPLYVTLAQRKDIRNTQMRLQMNAQNQMRFQQQAAIAGGFPGQFMGAPMLYPGQPGQGFMPPPGGPRGPFPGQMGPPRGGMPPIGQWQAGPGEPRSNFGGAHPASAVSGDPGVAAIGGFQPGSSEELASAIANMPEDSKKHVIGEILYHRIIEQDQFKGDEELTSRLTGMLLDMDLDDLYSLFDNEATLKEHVNEAYSAYLEYLKEAEQQ